MIGPRPEGMTHFGDPCIHCGVSHDDMQVGPCQGDPSKAKPIGYVVLENRPDGVQHYRIRFSDGRIEERHAHVSYHAEYYHFGHSDTLIQPPRYDVRLRT